MSKFRVVIHQVTEREYEYVEDADSSRVAGTQALKKFHTMYQEEASVTSQHVSSRIKSVRPIKAE